ncbi:MAG: preprotein translocase subunit YajC [Chlamydiota bacterium]
MKKFVFCLGSFASFLHADAPVAAASKGNFLQPLLMIGVAIVFFYFILWRPEQKRRKKMEAQRCAIKKGDRVTAMGIIGTVSRIKDTTIILKMIDGSEIEFLKAAISDVQPSSDEKSEEKKGDSCC